MDDHTVEIVLNSSEQGVYPTPGNIYDNSRWTSVLGQPLMLRGYWEARLITISLPLPPANFSQFIFLENGILQDTLIGQDAKPLLARIPPSNNTTDAPGSIYSYYTPADASPWKPCKRDNIVQHIRVRIEGTGGTYPPSQGLSGGRAVTLHIAFRRVTEPPDLTTFED